MTSDSTTLYAVYNDEPLPEFEGELPVLHHRITNGEHDPRLAVYNERESDDIEQQFREAREDNGNHIRVAEITVEDWNVDPDELADSAQA